MAPNKAQPARRAPRIVRIILARPRLFIAAAVAVIVSFIVPGRSLTTRLLIGWDIGVVLYLAAVSRLLAVGGVAYLRRRAASEDEGRFGVLVLTALAALTSLGAIVALLGGTQAKERAPEQLALAIVTILLSWAFIHVIFAVHYANEYYGAQRRKTEALAFPKDDEPDYWDFLYFSFVIGMTSQVSDVAVAAKSIRRIVLAHGIVSFLFNVTLLALTVNIAAGVIQNGGP
ncbi:MAG: DUF1345 domain-containing protein [Pseudolabrys sp.]